MAPGPFQPPRLRNKAAGVSLFDFLTFPAMQDKSCRSDSDDRPSSKWSAAVAREEQPEDRPRCSSQAPRDARLLATPNEHGRTSEGPAGADLALAVLAAFAAKAVLSESFLRFATLVHPNGEVGDGGTRARTTEKG